MSKTRFDFTEDLDLLISAAQQVTHADLRGSMILNKYEKELEQTKEAFLAKWAPAFEDQEDPSECEEDVYEDLHRRCECCGTPPSLPHADDCYFA